MLSLNEYFFPIKNETSSHPQIQDVSTEEEMTALLIEKNVGNVYRYTGETTDDYINGDLYVVEQLTISGTWQFREDMTYGALGGAGEDYSLCQGEPDYYASVNFTSNGEQFLGMYDEKLDQPIFGTDVHGQYSLYFITDEETFDSEEVCYSAHHTNPAPDGEDVTRWYNDGEIDPTQAHRTINFADNTPVSQQFYDFIQRFCTKL